MQNYNHSTTKDNLFNQLSKHFNINKEQKYFSQVDSEFEEIFAEILGRKLQCSVYISKNIEEKNIKVLRLQKGERFESGSLSKLGYKKVERVWEEGEFSILGDVVILWPHSMKNILRLSIWGEEIESIEIVEPSSRRKIEELQFKEILDANSSNIVGNECLSNSQLIYLTQDLELETYEVGLKRIPAIYSYIDLHTTENILRNYKKLGYKIWYLSKSLERFEKSQSNLTKYIDKYFETESNIEKNLSRGFVYEKAKLILLTDLEVLGEVDISDHKTGLRNIDASSLEILKKIVPGDYLVHEDHGIGIFKGVKEIEEKKYLDIHYAKSDKLLIPFNALEKVMKYIGVGRKKPVLTGLNSGIWSRISKSAKKQAESIAKELLVLYALRTTTTTEIVVKEGQLEDFWEFVSGFEFRDTEDQLVATKNIVEDFQNTIPMDRLLVGDVGFGKTEIAMRAAYGVVNAGFQVAILAPTTVLVEQHLKVLRKRFDKYPYVIESLSRFNTQTQGEKIRKGIESGGIDIVVGTHSLLSKKVKFKNLGLVILDEEQKFGVKQKEHLKGMRLNTNILSMTATPIPRTLNMSLMGIRDISVLATPPSGRKDIKNEFKKFSWKDIERVVTRELDRDGQVFFLHNRIGTIQFVQKRLQKIFPENVVEILHGQMSSKRIEQTMNSFVGGSIDILLCTTIIENGIDIHNVNTLIVGDINMFGLSQLYQLRGRIGRGSRQAYACFLFENLTSNSALRIGALKDSESLGSGFILSNRDLEIRGAGDILGSNQSGTINSIGYGLYTQMLSDAVKKLKA
ncbi:DEAD/DEAH box helicase [bacterium]|nr:DEAD/DEAH box helicase [bacterium]